MTTCQGQVADVAEYEKSLYEYLDNDAAGLP